jgi:YbbR domain-containing protein
VSVYGTDENLRSVDSIKTEAISVSGETKRISREVPLDVNSGNGLWVTPEAVSVTVQIVPVANLVVAHRDIVIRKSNENYRYSLQQKDVRIYLKGRKRSCRRRMKSKRRWICPCQR